MARRNPLTKSEVESLKRLSHASNKLLGYMAGKSKAHAAGIAEGMRKAAEFYGPDAKGKVYKSPAVTGGKHGPWKVVLGRVALFSGLQKKRHAELVRDLVAVSMGETTKKAARRLLKHKPPRIEEWTPPGKGGKKQWEFILDGQVVKMISTGAAAKAALASAEVSYLWAKSVVEHKKTPKAKATPKVKPSDRSKRLPDVTFDHRKWAVKVQYRVGHPPDNYRWSIFRPGKKAATKFGWGESRKAAEAAAKKAIGDAIAQDGDKAKAKRKTKKSGSVVGWHDGLGIKKPLPPKAKKLVDGVGYRRLFISLLHSYQGAGDRYNQAREVGATDEQLRLLAGEGMGSSGRHGPDGDVTSRGGKSLRVEIKPKGKPKLEVSGAGTALAARVLLAIPTPEAAATADDDLKDFWVRQAEQRLIEWYPDAAKRGDLPARHTEAGEKERLRRHFDDTGEEPWTKYLGLPAGDLLDDAMYAVRDPAYMNLLGWVLHDRGEHNANRFIEWADLRETGMTDTQLRKQIAKVFKEGRPFPFPQMGTLFAIGGTAPVVELIPTGKQSHSLSGPALVQAARISLSVPTKKAAKGADAETLEAMADEWSRQWMQAVEDGKGDPFEPPPKRQRPAYVEQLRHSVQTDAARLGASSRMSDEAVEALDPKYRGDLVKTIARHRRGAEDLMGSGYFNDKELLELLRELHLGDVHFSLTAGDGHLLYLSGKRTAVLPLTRLTLSIPTYDIWRAATWDQRRKWVRDRFRALALDARLFINDRHLQKALDAVKVMPPGELSQANPRRGKKSQAKYDHRAVRALRSFKKGTIRTHPATHVHYLDLEYALRRVGLRGLPRGSKVRAGALNTKATTGIPGKRVKRLAHAVHSILTPKGAKLQRGRKATAKQLRKYLSEVRRFQKGKRKTAPVRLAGPKRMARRRNPDSDDYFYLQPGYEMAYPFTTRDVESGVPQCGVCPRPSEGIWHRRDEEGEPTPVYRCEHHRPTHGNPLSKTDRTALSRFADTVMTDAARLERYGREDLARFARGRARGIEDAADVLPWIDDWPGDPSPNPLSPREVAALNRMAAEERELTGSYAARGLEPAAAHHRGKQHAFRTVRQLFANPLGLSEVEQLTKRRDDARSMQGRFEKNNQTGDARVARARGDTYNEVAHDFAAAGVAVPNPLTPNEQAQLKADAVGARRLARAFPDRDGYFEGQAAATARIADQYATRWNPRRRANRLPPGHRPKRRAAKTVKVARWETAGKKYWIDLWRRPDGRFYSVTPNGAMNYGNWTLTQVLTDLTTRIELARVHGINYRRVELPKSNPLTPRERQSLEQEAERAQAQSEEPGRPRHQAEWLTGYSSGVDHAIDTVPTIPDTLPRDFNPATRPNASMALWRSKKGAEEVVLWWESSGGFRVSVYKIGADGLADRVMPSRVYGDEAAALAAAKRKAKLRGHTAADQDLTVAERLKGPPRPRQSNPPPIVVIAGNPSSKQRTSAIRRWSRFHGAGSRGPSERTKTVPGDGELFLVLIGGARELKVKGQAEKKFGAAYKAYTTADGKTLILARDFKHIADDLELVGGGDYVTYSGPAFSATKRGVWWKHKFGKGVKVSRTRRGNIYVIRGGRFRVTDWLRD